MKRFSVEPYQGSHSPSTSLPHGMRLKTPGLDAIFSALSDPTRRAMLERLLQGETSVGELAKPFDVSLPAISKHLRVLEQSGLVVREREGRVHKLHLDPTPLMSTAAWIGHYRPLWEQHLDSLGSFLDTKKGAKKAK